MEISSEQFVLNILSDDAFVLVNKKILRYLKGDGAAAVFLGELVSMHKYNLNNQTLEPDNSFRCLTRRIEYAVGLSEYRQHRILEKFKECGLCKVELKYFPATKYATVNFDMLVKILAADDLKYKKVDQQNFYNELNKALNVFQTWTDSNSHEHIIENAEHCCDNMGESLKGTILLISQFYAAAQHEIAWTPKNMGQIRHWVQSRGMGKPFDFTLVTRTLCSIAPIQNIIKFNDFIDQFIVKAKATQDVHFSSQKYDYQGILKEI